MKLITSKNCQNCKMLRQMLGQAYFFVEIHDAEDEMEFCRKVGLKSVPALVKDDETYTTDLDEIVRLVEEQVGEIK